jgi:sugar (pentulose or hexulose) kinase
MSKLPVIVIFDIGKTNKKQLLFNQQYEVIAEASVQFEETMDEDGFPCDDITRLTGWIKNAFNELLADPKLEVKAVNFSGYGASFVFLDDDGILIPPIYNYLKPLDPVLQAGFYDKYGGESAFSRETASPVLGNLNSGMQLYRIKCEKPELFNRIACALHLPQYLAYILSAGKFSELTSIGCHTNLWSFITDNYHAWVAEEGIMPKLPQVIASDALSGFVYGSIPVGVGLHDSSAALIPYLRYYSEPFVLISTGTWCISLNPFNNIPLSDQELKQDCLCYISYTGKPVKASRLFAGHQHEIETARLAGHFKKPPDYYKSVKFDNSFVAAGLNASSTRKSIMAKADKSEFNHIDLNEFKSYEHAYHQLIADIICDQFISTNLVIKDTSVTTIYVDGGFSRNEIYMQLLAAIYPAMRVYAATIPQASALGAAMAMHEYWNVQPFPSNLIALKAYSIAVP